MRMIQMKKMAVAVAIAAASIGGASATTLAAGDFAFTGINVNSTVGGWSFVSFLDVAAGTTIYFTDTNVLAVPTATGVFSSTAETFWSWTAASDIAAGTSVSTLGTGGSGAFSSTNGTVSVVGGASAFNVSSGGDSFYAFQATSFALNYQPADITFLGATTSRAAATSADTPPSTLTGVALKNFYSPSVIRYTEFNGQINDTVYASVADLKTALGDSTQWTSISASNSTVIGDAVMLATAPVPEASTYAMLLAGLGMIGLMARRRTNA